jgi:hypothetical protein
MEEKLKEKLEELRLYFAQSNKLPSAEICELMVENRPSMEFLTNIGMLNDFKNEFIANKFCVCEMGIGGIVVMLPDTDRNMAKRILLEAVSSLYDKDTPVQSILDELVKATQ